VSCCCCCVKFSRFYSEQQQPQLTNKHPITPQVLRRVEYSSSAVASRKL
jgi:hypothetical protein